MEHFYTADIPRYVESERLPLWVEYVPGGSHGACLFHNHEFSEIALVLDGSATHLMEGERAGIHPGDLLVIHPGVSHAYDDTDDLELINVVYDHRQLPLPVLDGYSLPLFNVFFPLEEARKEHSTVHPIMRLDGDDLTNISRLIRRLEDELKSLKPGNFYLSTALFMELIVLLARHDASVTPEHQFRFQIGEVIGFMNRNLKRSTGIDELIAVSSMSRRDFFRKFRRSTGGSPIRYLLLLRLQRAAQLLIQSNMTLGEIALECGFCDSNYLCRMFRRTYNVSPRQFRLKNR